MAGLRFSRRPGADNRPDHGRRAGRVRHRHGGAVAASLVLVTLAVLSGCTGGAPLPPVFNAVFGLEDAESVPFRSGKLPEPVVEPGDRVLGLAANAPGQCIYLRANRSHRFIANCPEGYDV